MTGFDGLNSVCKNLPGRCTLQVEGSIQQVQHLTLLQQNSQVDLNPQPTLGASTIFKSQKACQVVQHMTSQSCKACGKKDHATKHCMRCSACEQLGHVACFCQFNTAVHRTPPRPCIFCMAHTIDVWSFADHCLFGQHRNV